MIRFAADEDLNNDVLRALVRRAPEVDIIRVQDAGLSGVEDPGVLEWAASNDRVLLTHDVATMTRRALDRVRVGKPMPGVIAIHQRLGIRTVVDDLILIARCGDPDDFSGRLFYLPL